MTPEQMKARTMEYGLRVIRVVQSLPRGVVADVLGRQLLKAGTSVGANYRAACRSRSDGDFLARLGVVEEEADESLYWMEMLVNAGIMREKRLAPLMREGDEILSIVVASLNTVKRRTRRKALPPSPVAGQAVDSGAVSDLGVYRRSPGKVVVQSEIRNPKSEMAQG